MSRPFKAPKKELLLCLAVALTLRLIAVGLSGPDVVRFGDAEDYLIHAGRLCTDGEYPERGNNHFFRAPGLPYFIAAVTFCQPPRILAVKVALAGIDTLTVALVGLLASLVWADGKAFRPAIWLAAVYPPFVVQVTDVRSEALFMFALTGGLVLLLKSRQTGRSRWLVAAGLATGLAALVRPSALFVVAFLAAVACLFPPGGRRWRLAGAGLVLAGSLLAIGPWTARNLLRFGEVILVNDATGINAYRGASPEMFGIMTASNPEDVASARRRFEEAYLEEAERIAVEGASPGERDRLWRNRTAELIAADPASYLGSLGWKAISYWRPWLNPRFHGPRNVALSAAILAPVLIGAMAGLSLLRRRDRWLFGALLAFLILGCLVHSPFQTVMRFRIPYTDPLYLALISGLLLRLWERAGRFPRSSPAP